MTTPTDGTPATTEAWTVGRILDWTTQHLKKHGSETPRLDAELLLAHCRGCARIQLYVQFVEIVSDEQRARMEELLAGPPDPNNVQWMYALEWSRVEAKPKQWPVQIQALRVGDVGMVGLPGEVFVEIGLEIKRRSPFDHTMVIELANDWVGYIPTDKALQEGSYETELGTNSMAVPGTADLWIETAVKLLNDLV